MCPTSLARARTIFKSYLLFITQLLLITRYHALPHLYFFLFQSLLRYSSKVSVQTISDHLLRLAERTRVLVASFYARYHMPDVAQRRRVIMRSYFYGGIRKRYAIIEPSHTYTRAHARWNRES